MALLGNNLAWKSWHRLALDSLSEGAWSEKFLFHARVYANSHPWGLERYKPATSSLHSHQTFNRLLFTRSFNLSYKHTNLVLTVKYLFQLKFTFKIAIRFKDC